MAKSIEPAPIELLPPELIRYLFDYIADGKTAFNFLSAVHYRHNLGSLNMLLDLVHKCGQKPEHIWPSLRLVNIHEGDCEVVKQVSHLYRFIIFSGLHNLSFIEKCVKSHSKPRNLQITVDSIDSTKIALQTILGPVEIELLELRDSCLFHNDTKRLSICLAGSNISTLDLSENHIGDEECIEIVKMLKVARITHLDLSWNSFETQGYIYLCQSTALENLCRLDLSGNHCDDSGAIELARCLPRTSLTRLDLTACGIGSSGALAIAECIRRTKLTHLAFNDNNIGDVGCVAIAKSLSKSRLLALDLEGNGIGDYGCKELAYAIGGSTLKYLNISQNVIMKDGYRVLIDRIRDNPIEIIYLFGCTGTGVDYEPSIIDDHNFNDSYLFSACNSILCVSLSHRDICDEECLPISAFLSEICSENSEIQFELDISNNNLCSEGCETLMNGLRLVQVTLLNFSNNYITDDGFYSVATCMKQGHLITLNMSSNKPTSTGCVRIAEALSDSNVVTLNLSGNYVSKIAAIAMAFSINTSMRDLKMSGCRIEDLGLGYLSKVLTSSSLSSLDIRDNLITSQGVMQFIKYLEESTIEKIFLSGRCLTKTVIDALKVECEKHGIEYNSSSLKNPCSFYDFVNESESSSDSSSDSEDS